MRWDEIWAARRLDRRRGSLLAQLMAADGLDTGFGDVGERAWATFVARTADTLGIDPGDRVLEVGCGGGAFLYPLAERGVAVAGIDRSAALIEIAREALPSGEFAVADAAELSGQADVVVSCGVFLYFEDLGYARRVLGAMAGAAQRAVAILDVPDLAVREAAIAHRVTVSGGPERYAERYAGLDHLYYDREWMRETLSELGLVDISVEDQEIDGYANGRFRFNAFARVPGA